LLFATLWLLYHHNSHKGWIMKRSIRKTIAALFLLIIMTVTSSCALIVTEAPHAHKRQHRNRVVIVSGIQYNQVYYVENNNVVIVSQKEVEHKPKKPKHNKGHHGH